MDRPNFARTASRRAQVLIWLLLAKIGVSAVATLITVWGSSVVNGVFDRTASIDDVAAFDSVFALSGIVEAGVYVGAGVAWLAWLSRTVENAPTLGFGQPIVSPRWAIGWWFIPFANLVKGYQIVRDLYVRMCPSSAWTHRPVVAWWSLFLLMGVISNAAGRYWLAETTDTQGELQFGLALWVWAEVATVAAAFAAIVVVQRLQRWAGAAELRVAAARETAALAPPAVRADDGSAIEVPST